MGADVGTGAEGLGRYSDETFGSLTFGADDAVDAIAAILQDVLGDPEMDAREEGRDIMRRAALRWERGEAA